MSQSVPATISNTQSDTNLLPAPQSDAPIHSGGVQLEALSSPNRRPTVISPLSAYLFSDGKRIDFVVSNSNANQSLSTMELRRIDFAQRRETREKIKQSRIFYKQSGRSSHPVSHHAKFDFKHRIRPHDESIMVGSDHSNVPFIHQTPVVSIAQRLHTDALHCIFAFLHLREPRTSDFKHDHHRLLPAILTCKAWYKAALKEKQRNEEVKFSQHDGFLKLCFSPLRFHVTQLFIGKFYSSIRDLNLIQSYMRHLLSLRLALDTSTLLPVLADEQARYAFIQHCFPRKLISLDITFTSDNMDLSLCQLVIDAIPSALDLSTLVLRLPSQRDDPNGVCLQLNLSPLLQLTMLSTLQWGSNRDRWADFDAVCTMSLIQLAAVKQIPSLTNFHYNQGEWSEEEIAAAFSLPHQLQNMKDVALLNTEVNSSILSHLSSLPSLTQLKPMRLRPDAYPLLSRFTQLRSLYLNAKTPTPTSSELSSLCDALQSCTLLRKLDIRNIIRESTLIRDFFSELRSGSVHPVLTVNGSTLRTAETNSLHGLRHDLHHRSVLEILRINSSNIELAKSKQPEWV